MSRKKSNKRRYHHGNLREALIQTAVELIRESGSTSFTLRQLAKRIGVSHAAAYHHFNDKTALLVAVAEEGFRVLIERMLSIDEERPIDRLFAMCEAYLHYALEHQAHFRVMFGELATEHDLQNSGELGVQALFEQGIEACLHEGSLRGSDDRLVETIWSLVHGLAHLAISGHLDSREISARLDVMLRALVQPVELTEAAPMPRAAG